MSKTYKKLGLHLLGNSLHSCWLTIILVSLTLSPNLAQTEPHGTTSRAREFTRAVWHKTSRYIVDPSLEQLRERDYGTKISVESLTDKQRGLLEQINQTLKELRQSTHDTTLKWHEGRLEAQSIPMQPNAEGVYERVTTPTDATATRQKPFVDDFFPREWQLQLNQIDNLWLEFRRETVRSQQIKFLRPGRLQALRLTATLVGIIDLATHQAIPGRDNLWTELAEQASFTARFFGNLSTAVADLLQQLTNSGLVGDPHKLRDPVSGGIDIVALRRELQRICNGYDMATLQPEMEKQVAEWRAWLELLRTSSDKISRILTEELLAKRDPRFAAVMEERFGSKSAKDIRLKPFWFLSLVGAVPDSRLSTPVQEVLRQKGYGSAQIFAMNLAAAFPQNVGAGVHFLAAKFVADTIGWGFGFAPKTLPRFLDSMANIEHVLMLGLNLTGFYYANWGFEWAIDRTFKSSMTAFKENYQVMQARWLKLPGSNSLAPLSGAAQTRTLLVMGLRAGVSLAAIMTLLDSCTLYFSHPDHKEADYLDGLGLHSEADTLRSKIKDETWFNSVFAASTFFNVAFFTAIPTLLSMGIMSGVGAAGKGALFAAGSVGGPFLITVGLIVALAGHVYINENIIEPWRQESMADDMIDQKMLEYSQMVETTIANVSNPGSLYDKLDRLLEKLNLNEFFQDTDPAEERKIKTTLLQAMIEGNIDEAINGIIMSRVVEKNGSNPSPDPTTAQAVLTVPVALLSAQPQLAILRELYRYHLGVQISKGNRKFIDADKLTTKIREAKGTKQFFSPEYAPMHQFLEEMTRYQAHANLLGIAFENYRNFLGFKEISKCESEWQKKQERITTRWKDRFSTIATDLIMSQRLPGLIAAAYLDRSRAEAVATAMDVTMAQRFENLDNDMTLSFLRGKSPDTINRDVVNYWGKQPEPLTADFFDGPRDPKMSEIFTTIIGNSTLYQHLVHGETDRRILEVAAQALIQELLSFVQQKLKLYEQLELFYEEELHINTMQKLVAKIPIGSDREEEVLRKQIIAYDLGRDEGDAKDEVFETSINEKAGDTTGNWQYHWSLHGADRTTDWSSLLSSEQAFWASSWWRLDEKSDGLLDQPVAAAAAILWIANDQRQRLYSTFVEGLRLSHLIRWVGGQSPADLFTFRTTQAQSYVDNIQEVDPEGDSPVLKLELAKAHDVLTAGASNEEKK